MASTFPTSLDTFTNPTATSLLTSPSHSLSHSDLNDAVEALETKVAIGNTVLGVYQAYTPTLSGITIGNGTIDAKYCRVNDFVHAIGRIVFGSTTAVTGTTYVTLPVNCDAIESLDTSSFGDVYFLDSSSGAVYPSDGVSSGGLANRAYISVLTASATYVARSNISATVPFTWATGDCIGFNFMYKAA